MFSRFFIAVLLLTVSAQAKKSTREPQQVGGDIGMRAIEVASMELKNATVGSAMSFRGSEAQSLYFALPKSFIEDDPEESSGFIAKGPQQSVLVKCVKNQITRNGTYKPVAGGPLCSVIIKTTPAEKTPPEIKWVQPKI